MQMLSVVHRPSTSDLILLLELDFLIQILGCGHQINKKYRCVICEEDVTGPVTVKQQQKRRRFDLYNSGMKGQLGWSNDYAPLITNWSNRILD